MKGPDRIIMKREDKKKNTKEAQRVFIQNLPKPKRWWQEYAFIIAVLALCISIYSAYLSRKEFIAAHRPYVFASPRRITKNGRATMDVNTFILRCLNAPAKIISQEVDCLVLKTKENGEEEVIKKIPVNERLDNNVLYPSENTTVQITIRDGFIKDILATNPEDELKIKVRLEYKALSTDRKYDFEGNWDYNRKYNVWQTNNMFAD